MKGMRIAAIAPAIARTMLLASRGRAQQPQQSGTQKPESTSEGGIG